MTDTKRTYDTPVEPSMARYILRINKVTQADLARELGYNSRSAVTAFLEGRAPSKKFWDHFLKRFPGAKKMRIAS